MCPNCRQQYLNQSAGTQEEEVDGNQSEGLLKSTEFQEGIDGTNSQGELKTKNKKILFQSTFQLFFFLKIMV